MTHGLTLLRVKVLMDGLLQGWLYVFTITRTSANSTGRISKIARRRISGSGSSSRSTNRRSQGRRTRTSFRSSGTALITKKPDLNKRDRRNLPKSQLKKTLWLGRALPPPLPNSYSSPTVKFDKGMCILISRMCNAGASQKHIVLCADEIIELKHVYPRPKKEIHYKIVITK